jgi:PII-like signaling protein
MKATDVTCVRVYLTEAEGKLEHLLECLHDDQKVLGVTVYRGISGFGRHGRMHSSSLLDISLNLPLVIEFFDAPEKTATIIEYLYTQLDPGHIVSWPATVYV